MAQYVLDSSALLAHLHNERGADSVEQALIEGSFISTANLAEVLSKLAEAGDDPNDVMAGLQRQGLLQRLTIMPVTVEDAVAIALLHSKTKALGLSLGDRTCLALAQRLQLPVLTADHAWARAKLSVGVETIR